MFTYGRDGMDLNGTWKFCPDPMQRCRRQKWWRNPSKRDEIFPCWDEEGLWEIQVPGTWKTQFPELKWYDGHADYMKNFDFDGDLEGKEAYLCFDGVVYESEIYLNGLFVGKHEWGYSAFRFRVTEYLRKHNQLFVLVDNHLRADRVPGEIFDWNNDGGIINGVKLVVVPAVHVENFRTWTHLDGDVAELNFEMELASLDAAATRDVSVRIPELGLSGECRMRVGEKAVVTFRRNRKEMTLWSTENPKLYAVEVVTKEETLRDEIGFREIKTCGRDILLNGEKIRLYGICTHSEFPGTGRTATEEGVLQLIDHAKKLGLNFLRCAHYPYAEMFGRAMDRAGMLWWEEVPAYWLFAMREPNMTRKAMGMMEDTVRRDWNRASLIFWSVSNECCWRNPDNHDEHNYSYWISQVKRVRELDPSRLISCAEASNHTSINSNWSPRANDEFVTDYHEQWVAMHSTEWYHLFDVLSANLYLNNGDDAQGAYSNFVRMCKPYNKPLVLSEFGSMSLLGAQVPEDQLGSEERHAKLLRDTYEVLKGLPEISGYCPWCLTDIRVPIHWRWYIQGKGMFRYGAYDECYRPKKAAAELTRSVAMLKKHFDK